MGALCKISKKGEKNTTKKGFFTVKVLTKWGNVGIIVMVMLVVCLQS